MSTTRKETEEMIQNAFPKIRSDLPKEYKDIYDEHYKNNRTGSTKVSSLSMKMENWLHKKVANDAKKQNSLTTLELGAGTLNQLGYEQKGNKYDIVEPFELLYLNSKYISKVDDIYKDISEVEGYGKYDRITAIATFEHICNLPQVVSKCKELLKDDGILRVSIPNEGRFLWKFAYKITTGLEFKCKYGLDYEVLMNYEHVNNADEIENVLKHYFDDVKCSLFGISKTFAFYRYYECRK